MYESAKIRATITSTCRSMYELARVRATITHDVQCMSRWESGPKSSTWRSMYESARIRATITYLTFDIGVGDNPGHNNLPDVRCMSWRESGQQWPSRRRQRSPSNPKKNPDFKGIIDSSLFSVSLSGYLNLYVMTCEYYEECTLYIHMFQYRT